MAARESVGRLNGIQIRVGTFSSIRQVGAERQWKSRHLASTVRSEGGSVVQTVDPRTIRPDVDVGRPKTPESASRPVPVLTTILFVLTIVVLAMVVVV